MSKKRILTDEEKEKIQEAKEELNEYREDLKYIEEKMEDNEEVKAKIEKITASYTEVKTKSSNESTDKFADALSKIEELNINCTEKMKELLIKKFVIDEKIEQVGGKYRNVLFFRYTKGLEWNDVAKQVGYSKDYTCELHGEALYLYSKI